MLQWLSRYRDVVTVVICLFIPGVILYAQSRSDAEAGPAVRAIIQLTAPLQQGMAAVVEGVSDWWTVHRQNAESLEELRALRMELAEVRAAAARADELGRENQRLRDLLRAAPTPGPAKVVGARVVAVGASPAFRSVRIDVGRDDGVRRGMAVISSDGAMGSILRTSSGYADVLLVSDRQSAVDVLLPRSGARGILTGSGAEDVVGLRVDGLDRTDDVQVGDQVVASGLGARFPRGTVVGTVSAVEPDGIFQQTAIVTPAVNFPQVRNVLVVMMPEDRAYTWQGPALQPEASPPPVAVGPQPMPASTATRDAGPTPEASADLLEAPPAWVKTPAKPDAGVERAP